MKGILSKTKNGWVVNYAETFNNHTLPIHPDSLSNPSLSTYWVPGREVEFEIETEYRAPNNYLESDKYPVGVHFAKITLNIPGDFFCEDTDCPHCKYDESDMDDLITDELDFCEEHGFEKNEYGNFIYISKNGDSSINLAYVLEDYKQWLIDKKILKDD